MLIDNECVIVVISFNDEELDKIYKIAFKLFGSLISSKTRGIHEHMRFHIDPNKIEKDDIQRIKFINLLKQMKYVSFIEGHQLLIMTKL